ncbi:MAG: beta-lactamase family protein, partial [Oscillospiraceae bacterium]|nr:beta-lactamase family protein [Oscillospiraceae bacterium]
MNLVKLENITKMMKGQVESGEVKGASAYVLRGGHPIYRANVGMADEARGIKWENDTIVRLYSATKNITAAAVMIL